MSLSSILPLDFIIVVLCLLIFALSIWGKIAPQMAVLAIILLCAFYFGLSQTLPIKTPQPLPQMTLNDSITIIPDTLATNSNPADSSLSPPREKSPPKREKPSPYNIPEDYEVDEAFRTFKTEGKWNKAFLQAFEDKTGWREKRNGNFILAIDFDAFFDPVQEDSKNKFNYKGGTIEITVNGKRCCCPESLKFPVKISGRKMGEIQKLIDKQIATFLLQNQDFVISKIAHCL
ncbi:MAG: hypothetical protein AAGG75_03115 [Bacteroidota bacterium]